MKLDAAAVRALNLLPNPLDGTVLPLDILLYPQYLHVHVVMEWKSFS